MAGRKSDECIKLIIHVSIGTNSAEMLAGILHVFISNRRSGVNEPKLTSAAKLICLSGFLTLL